MASILLHLSILVIVLSLPMKPSCNRFGARKIVNLTFLPLYLVLARASCYSAMMSFLHLEQLTHWQLTNIFVVLDSTCLILWNKASSK